MLTRWVCGPGRICYHIGFFTAILALTKTSGFGKRPKRRTAARSCQLSMSEGSDRVLSYQETLIINSTRETNLYPSLYSSLYSSLAFSSPGEGFRPGYSFFRPYSRLLCI